MPLKALNFLPDADTISDPRRLPKNGMFTTGCSSAWHWNTKRPTKIRHKRIQSSISDQKPQLDWETCSKITASYQAELMIHCTKKTKMDSASVCLRGCVQNKLGRTRDLSSFHYGIEKYKHIDLTEQFSRLQTHSPFKTIYLKFKACSLTWIFISFPPMVTSRLLITAVSVARQFNSCGRHPMHFVPRLHVPYGHKSWIWSMSCWQYRMSAKVASKLLRLRHTYHEISLLNEYHRKWRDVWHSFELKEPKGFMLLIQWL